MQLSFDIDVPTTKHIVFYRYYGILKQEICPSLQGAKDFCWNLEVYDYEDGTPERIEDYYGNVVLTADDQQW